MKKKGKTMVGFTNTKTIDKCNRYETMGAVGMAVSGLLFLAAVFTRDDGIKWYEPNDDATEETLDKLHDTIKSEVIK